MKTTNTKKQNIKPTPGEGRQVEQEIFLAPPPPSKGRIIGLDCHPDTFTAVVLRGTTPHDAVKLITLADVSLQKLIDWAVSQFTRDDLFLMEAGSNSFEIHRRLLALGMRAVVMESSYVGRHAKTYADNDKMAAERIALVYLQGKAPCVWVPDSVTCERRELLHAYNAVVAAHTAAVNSFKGYLNQYAVRLTSKQQPAAPKTEAWVLAQREWTPVQRTILANLLENLRTQGLLKKNLLRLIGQQICAEPLMLRCMRILGIGQINAFALLATIGNVKRFERPEKLVAYLGLNPGQRVSGRGKIIKVGIGRRGRSDMRALLMQGAHAVFRMGRTTALGQWGWKLFARKGSRNIAVAAVARKLAVQVWHALSGNPPESLETDKSFDAKMQKLAVTLGKNLREQLALPSKLKDCSHHLKQTILNTPTIV